MKPSSASVTPAKIKTQKAVWWRLDSISQIASGTRHRRSRLMRFGSAVSNMPGRSLKECLRSRGARHPELQEHPVLAVLRELQLTLRQRLHELLRLAAEDQIQLPLILRQIVDVGAVQQRHTDQALPQLHP